MTFVCPPICCYLLVAGIHLTLAAFMITPPPPAKQTEEVSERGKGGSNYISLC
jgi:hypothetical protein